MEYKTLANNISTWLKRYIQSNGLNCFVIGISGGIDSATTSELCAMTGIKTYMVNIPIKSKKENTKLSLLHSRYLEEKYSNVEYLEYDLSDVFDTFINTLDSRDGIDFLSSANSKSRMRMVTLYYIAGKRKGIVVGTGNKIEDFGVGFYTKYGDGGVDISPIADLTKTQVREMAKVLGIDNSIIEAPPTDGLWEDSRTDEDQIGATYEELEWAMSNIGIDSENFTKRQKEVIEIYAHYNIKNSHKMNPIPIYMQQSNKF